MWKDNKTDMTVREQIEAVKEEICDEYCKYTLPKYRGNYTQETLNEICENCPLKEL